MSDSTKAKCLALKQDRIDGHLVVYFQTEHGKIVRVSAREEKAQIDKDLAGYIDTERYLKDDRIAEPYPDLVHASDVSEWFFENPYQDRKRLAKYLKGLDEKITALIKKKGVWEELEIKYEAGLLTLEDPLLGAITHNDILRF